MKEKFPSGQPKGVPGGKEDSELDLQHEIIKGIEGAHHAYPPLHKQAQEVWGEQETARQERMTAQFGRFDERVKAGQKRIGRLSKEVAAARIEANTEQMHREQREMAELAARHEAAKQNLPETPPANASLGSRVAAAAERMRGPREQAPPSPEHERSPVEAREELQKVRGEINTIERDIVGTPRFGAGNYQEQLADIYRRRRELETISNEAPVEAPPHADPEHIPSSPEALTSAEQQRRLEEFRAAYDQKTEEKVRQRAETWGGKGVEYLRRTVEWYGKLPFRYKLGISAALAGAGAATSIGIGIAGAGMTWAALAGFVGGGRIAQRALAGGATFISLERFLAHRYRKKFSAELERRFDDAFTRNIESLKANHSEGLVSELQRQDALQDAQAELEHELRQVERQNRTRRLLIAGGAMLALQFVPSMLVDHVRDLSSSPVGPSSLWPEWPGQEAGEAARRAPGGVSAASPEDPLEAFGGRGPENTGTSIPAETPNVEWRTATSIWNLTERELEARKLFNGLNEAQKTYVIDAIKDRIAENPQEFGLKNADVFTPNTFDHEAFTRVLGNEQELSKILSRARGLSPEDVNRILQNNRTLHDFFRAHPDAPRTSTNYDAVLRGTGGAGDALLTAPVTPEPSDAPWWETEKPGENHPAFSAENPPPSDAVGNIQNTEGFSTYAETFSGLRNEIGAVFGNKAEEATVSINNYMTLHPDTSLEKLTVFVGEMDEIDTDTMKLLFEEGGDSAENRLALLRNLLIDERLNLNTFHAEQLTAFEDLVEDSDRFHALIKESPQAELSQSIKLEALRNYLAEGAPEVTGANKAEILDRILPAESPADIVPEAPVVESPITPEAPPPPDVVTTIGPVGGTTEKPDALGALFGEHRAAAADVLARFSTMHTDVSMEEISVFVEEVVKAKPDTLTLLLGEQGDLAGKRLTFLQALLNGAEGHTEQMASGGLRGFETMLEGNEGFRPLLEDPRIQGLSPGRKLRMLARYIFERRAPAVTAEGKEEIIADLLNVE